MYIFTQIIFIFTRDKCILMVNPDFTTISDIISKFPDEASCMAHLERLRWNGFVTSPFDPISRVYRCSGNRYKCRNSGKYFNAKTGTIFYNSKIGLQSWFIAIWIVSNSNKPVTSVALGKKLGLTQKSAWHMLQRIKTYLGTAQHQDQSVLRTLNSKKTKTPEEIAVIADKDKLHLLEWLQLLKK